MRLAGSPADRGRALSFLCAQQAQLAERAFQKIILHRQLPDLGVQRLEIDRRLPGRERTTEHVGGAIPESRRRGHAGLDQRFPMVLLIKSLRSFTDKF